ncbi:MAG: hypothetical protein IGS23_24475 [Rivularia sp. T60_A2020_040]|nr:hypothetical protein [Rivularia sp. T60_A2020_040]
MNKQLGDLLPRVAIVAIVLFLALFVRSSEKLNCNKLEKNHTECQLQKNLWMFGLVSTSVEKFQLTKTDIKIRIEEDSEGNTTRIYKLLLYEQNKSFEFYEHEKLAFFDNDAESDKKRIDTFLVEGNEKATLEIHSKWYVRRVKHLVDGTLMLIILRILSLILCAIGSVFRRY